jgi:hypothetical protein
MRNDATDADVLLRAAIDSFAKAFRTNPGRYDFGIQALLLMSLYGHLTNDPHYDASTSSMVGSVRFAADGESDERRLFRSKATIGALEVLAGSPDTVRAAFGEAIAKNENDWFALDSIRARLQLLQQLGFRPDHVAAGIATFDRAVERLHKPEERWQPRQVLLFSGHMVDAPDRPTPRFPIDKEPIAAQKIGEALDQLRAGPEDLALCQAAAGGDLLFLEACQLRGVRCQILLPFSEPEFIERSIAPSADSDRWRERYFAMKAKLTDPVRSMPDELGPLPKGVDPFERCNLWLLYTALAAGVDKVRFMALWNGSGGDGPGGTAHMHNEVERRTGEVQWLDTRTLW